MRMMKEVTFFSSLLVVVVLLHGAAASDVCTLVKNGTKIQDPSSCTRYITCINFVSRYTTCPSNMPFFDKQRGACAAELEDYSSCMFSCANAAGRFMNDPVSCTGYYYCLNDYSALHGDCPQEMYFNFTKQACVYKDKSSCSIDDLNFCAFVKDGVPIKNTNRCDSYYTCKEGELIDNKCKTGYFDVVTGQCIQKSFVDCPQHPLPVNVCGTEAKPLRNKYVSDGATCRGYYYCADKGPKEFDKNPQRGLCPHDTFFDPSSSTCVAPVNVVCAEDRCDGRTKTFVVAGDKGCRNYLRCKNGITSEKLSCGNRFFDEDLVACIDAPKAYKACAK